TSQPTRWRRSSIKRKQTMTERRRASSPRPEQPTILPTSYTYLGVVRSARRRCARRAWWRAATHTYLGARWSRRRMSNRGRKETAHYTSGAEERRLRCNEERVKARGQAAVGSSSRRAR